jgi:hypothetical protein
MHAVRWTAAWDLCGDDAEGVCQYVVSSGALDRGVAWDRATRRAWACQRMAPTRLHACTDRATSGSRHHTFDHVSSTSGAGSTRLHRRAPGVASWLEQRQATAEKRRWDATAHRNRHDGSRRQANTWATLWRMVVTGGRPVAGNLASEDTRGRSRGNLVEEGANRQAPSASDDGVVMGWQAGLERGDGLGSTLSWAGRGESGPQRFSNLNPFSN